MFIVEILVRSIKKFLALFLLEFFVYTKLTDCEWMKGNMSKLNNFRLRKNVCFCRGRYRICVSRVLEFRIRVKCDSCSIEWRKPERERKRVRWRRLSDNKSFSVSLRFDLDVFFFFFCVSCRKKQIRRRKTNDAMAYTNWYLFRSFSSLFRFSFYRFRFITFVNVFDFVLYRWMNGAHAWARAFDQNLFDNAVVVDSLSLLHFGQWCVISSFVNCSHSFVLIFWLFLRFFYFIVSSINRDCAINNTFMRLLRRADLKRKEFTFFGTSVLAPIVAADSIYSVIAFCLLLSISLHCLDLALSVENCW